MPEEPLPARKPEPSERELRAMLEGRERELEAKLKNQGRIVSRILPVAGLLFLAWAGYVYMVSQRTFNEAEAAPMTGPAPSTLPALPTAADAAATTPMEWPGEPGQKKAAPVDPNNILTTPTSHKLDHGDVRFAMELMNYMQPGKAHPQEPPPPAQPPK